MQKDKKHVLILGDHMFHLSGVAHCLRDITNSLVSTGKFRVIQLGAAIKHEDMRPMKVNDDVIIIPCEGFGTIDQVNQICIQNQIDIILFQSDPRFYQWLLVRDNEVRKNIPMVWYSIWDHNPYPIFNDWVWNSVDYTVAISRLTEDLVRTVSKQTEVVYMPHCINTNVFKPLSQDERIAFRNKTLPFAKDKMLFFWNNRNGRRKNGATLLVAFKKFLDIVGQDKAVLLMKTDPIDQVGFNLPAIIDGYELEGKAFLLAEKFDEPTLASMYSCADCVINVANAEGFGMSNLEAMACGTPTIATWTGGLREQICDDINNPNKWFGFPVFPASRAVIGSPELPWIYEDQISEEDLIDALIKMYNLGSEKRIKMGENARDHILNNFNWQNFCNFWPMFLESVANEHGSWPNKSFKPWKFTELGVNTRKHDSEKKPWELPPCEFVNKSNFDFEKLEKSLEK